eukprot:11181981-Lingulodinium_polyedra.AAC.1
MSQEQTSPIQCRGSTLSGHPIMDSGNPQQPAKSILAGKIEWAFRHGFGESATTPEVNFSRKIEWTTLATQ